MSTTFPPPPTYAEVFIADPASRKPKINPIWLQWFVQLAEVITNSGGGGGAISHNSLAGLQGGTSGDYEHLIGSERALLHSAQVAREFLAGPVSGGAAPPDYRVVVLSDLPPDALALSAAYG